MDHIVYSICCFLSFLDIQNGSGQKWMFANALPVGACLLVVAQSVIDA